MESEKSFTLIELLVVIAIIGILSGLIIVSMNGATNAAKDARVKEDMNQLSKAFAMYGAQNSVFPSTGGTTCNLGDPASSGTCATLNSLLSPEYFSSFPKNPNTNAYYTYASTDGADYTLSGVMSDTYAYSYSPVSGYTTSSLVPGQCGSSSGQTLASEPSSNLCLPNDTYASEVSGSGPWSWDCSGQNGGSTTHCATTISKSSYVTANCPASASCSLVSSTDMVIQWTTVGSYTWTVPSGVSSVQYLVVGGGGGGGHQYGGGGGGGGFLQSTNYSVTANSSFTIVVGAGGSAGTVYCPSGQNAKAGGNSSFGDSVVAYGGGGGGSSDCNGNTSGGSGGGASNGGTGANGVTGQGNNGGSSAGSTEYNLSGGGGGGAGMVGPNGVESSCVNGGDGLASSITGTSIYYAGGGAGGVARNYSGSGCSGGLGGGGTGGTMPGGAGTNGLGGGGGGGRRVSNTQYGGGAGGSGVVIVRFVIP